jgi:hypothetical protein
MRWLCKPSRIRLRLQEEKVRRLWFLHWMWRLRYNGNDNLPRLGSKHGRNAG